MTIVTASLAEPAGSLKRKAIVGSVWTFAGYGGAQVLRLASNLVLTRLLAPEFFGLMTLITMLLIGLAMFSDLGISPNIVQSERAEDQRFLDTAFTLQFMRGCLLWLVCLLAAYPFAMFYNEPRFIWLVPVVGLSVVISGLNSTKMASVNRKLLLGRITLIEIGAQAVTAATTIACAAAYAGVWALVVGSLLGIAIKAIASHVCLPGVNNRFHWDPVAARSLIKFGRWIFLSTVFAFASNSAGSLILGKFMSMAEVGIFSIAVTLSKVIEQAYGQLSNSVLLPVFVKIKDLPILELRKRLLKIRVGAMALFLPPLWLMAVFGQQIIAFMFDKRYHSGGWILQVFATCSILSVVNGTSTYYLAKGNSFIMMNLSIIRMLSYLLAMYLGWQFYGVSGLIVGMAAYMIPVYLVELWVQRSFDIVMPELDIGALALSGVIIVGGLKATGQI